MVVHFHSIPQEETFMVIPARIMTKKVGERVMALEKRVEVLERIVKKLRTKLESLQIE